MNGPLLLFVGSNYKLQTFSCIELGEFLEYAFQVLEHLKSVLLNPWLREFHGQLNIKKLIIHFGCKLFIFSFYDNGTGYFLLTTNSSLEPHRHPDVH